MNVLFCNEDDSKIVKGSDKNKCGNCSLEKWTVTVFWLWKYIGINYVTFFKKTTSHVHKKNTSKNPYSKWVFNDEQYLKI